MSNHIEQAPKSSDAEGRLFFCVNSRMGEEVFNNGQMVLHDYSTDKLSQFSQAMGITAMCAPEKIVERFKGIEPKIADIIATLHQQIASVGIPTDLLNKLLHGKFDVTVLLKSRGGGTSVAAIFNQYFDSVVAQEGVETVACSTAHSAAHTVFAHGKRRIALPSTAFMMHRSAREGVSRDAIGQSPSSVTEPIRKFITEVDDPAIERVLLSIQEPHRSRIAHVFEKDKDSLASERRID